MSDDQPLVSIITPVYNGSEYLEALIRSVLEQDYPSIEHIIIDDGSTDDGKTVAILERYSHLRWWSRPNRGQYATINEGFRESKGAVLTTISADDVYASPSIVGTAVRRLGERPEVGGVFGYTIMGDERAYPLPVQPPRRLPYWALPFYLFVAHCSLFVRSHVITSGGIYFDESLRYRGDRDWILKIARAGHRFSYLDMPAAVYRQHEAQITQNADVQARQSEDLVVDHRYGVSPRARAVVSACMAWRRRALTATWALRSGGAGALAAELRAWRRRVAARR